jgi:hypothetical protein
MALRYFRCVSADLISRGSFSNFLNVVLTVAAASNFSNALGLSDRLNIALGRLILCVSSNEKKKRKERSSAFF